MFNRSHNVHLLLFGSSHCELVVLSLIRMFYFIKEIGQTPSADRLTDTKVSYLNYAQVR